MEYPLTFWNVLKFRIISTEWHKLQKSWSTMTFKTVINLTKLEKCSLVWYSCPMLSLGSSLLYQLCSLCHSARNIWPLSWHLSPYSPWKWLPENNCSSSSHQQYVQEEEAHSTRKTSSLVFLQSCNLSQKSPNSLLLP